MWVTFVCQKCQHRSRKCLELPNPIFSVWCQNPKCKHHKVVWASDVPEYFYQLLRWHAAQDQNK